MPQNIAGCRIEPPVSVPVVTGRIRAATDAAEPPDEPPETSVVFHGFFTVPKYDVSFDEPIAYSSMLSLPIVTMPAALSRPVTCDSYGATKLESIREAQVVRQPSVRNRSLCPIGTPVSGVVLPDAMRASAARASATERSGSSVMNA